MFKTIISQIDPFSDECRITSGLQENCNFPFLYHGILYNGCVPRINQHKNIDYWCIASINYDSDALKFYESEHIGYCSAKCSKTTALGNHKILKDSIRNRFIILVHFLLSCLIMTNQF